MRAKSCQQAKRYIWHTAAGGRTKSCEQLNNQQMNQQLTDAKQQNFSNPLISNASHRRKSSKGATRHYLT